MNCNRRLCIEIIHNIQKVSAVLSCNYLGNIVFKGNELLNLHAELKIFLKLHIVYNLKKPISYLNINSASSCSCLDCLHNQSVIYVRLDKYVSFENCREDVHNERILWFTSI